MSTLTLDQSLSSTGFAIMAGGEVRSGSFPLCDGIKHRAQGFRVLWHWLDAAHKEHHFTEIVHEQVVMKRTDKREKLVALYGLVAVIELFSISRGLGEPEAYDCGTWRMSAFNSEERRAFKGKDWKEPAKARCVQLGFEPKDGDEAEALLILDHHLIAKKLISNWRADNPFLCTLA